MQQFHFSKFRILLGICLIGYTLVSIAADESFSQKPGLQLVSHELFLSWNQKQQLAYVSQIKKMLLVTHELQPKYFGHIYELEGARPYASAYAWLEMLTQTVPQAEAFESDELHKKLLAETQEEENRKQARIRAEEERKLNIIRSSQDAPDQEQTNFIEGVFTEARSNNPIYRDFKDQKSGRLPVLNYQPQRKLQWLWDKVLGPEPKHTGGNLVCMPPFSIMRCSSATTSKEGGSPDCFCFDQAEAAALNAGKDPFTARKLNAEKEAIASQEKELKDKQRKEGAAQRVEDIKLKARADGLKRQQAKLEQEQKQLAEKRAGLREHVAQTQNDISDRKNKLNQIAHDGLSSEQKQKIADLSGKSSEPAEGGEIAAAQNRKDTPSTSLANAGGEAENAANRHQDQKIAEAQARDKKDGESKLASDPKGQPNAPSADLAAKAGIDSKELASKKLDYKACLDEKDAANKGKNAEHLKKEKSLFFNKAISDRIASGKKSGSIDKGPIRCATAGNISNFRVFENVKVRDSKDPSKIVTKKRMHLPESWCEYKSLSDDNGNEIKCAKDPQGAKMQACNPVWYGTKAGNDGVCVTARGEEAMRQTYTCHQQGNLQSAVDYIKKNPKSYDKAKTDLEGLCTENSATGEYFKCECQSMKAMHQDIVKMIEACGSDPAKCDISNAKPQQNLAATEKPAVVAPPAPSSLPQQSKMADVNKPQMSFRPRIFPGQAAEANRHDK